MGHVMSKAFAAVSADAGFLGLEWIVLESSEVATVPIVKESQLSFAR
jgi:hypothetical protein